MVIDKRLFGKKIANHFDYSTTQKGLKSLIQSDFNSSSGGLQSMTINLERMAATCLMALRIVDIDESEIALLQSDRWKYGEVPPEEICWLIELHDHVIEALNHELASLCGEVVS